MYYSTEHNFDMLSGKVASSELSSLKTEPNKIVQTTCYTGYQDKNGSANLFPPMESENVNEVLKRIERYNRLKEAELCCEIQKAQIQVL